MLYFNDLLNITGGEIVNLHNDLPIEHLLTDSRKILISPGSIFFAITGERHDGHQFIGELYDKGIRQFVIETTNKLTPEIISNSNIIQTESSLSALQSIAEYHRMGFDIPVIGITGSNGKTIIKEWLYEMLSTEINIVKSPKSYNSQLGVPLSVWQINTSHELGIFEAGISEPGKMEALQKIIRPTVGIFTNIGQAHSENFASIEEKVGEKAMLFKSCQTILYCRDYDEVHQHLKQYFPNTSLFCWSSNDHANVTVKDIEKENGYSRLTLEYENKVVHFDVPFTDKASIENSIHCIVYLLYENFTHSFIQKQLNRLQNVSMRLELKQGINNSYLIDDSYNNDLAGLQVALDFLDQQKQRDKKTVILSDILQSGMEPKKLYKKVAALLKEKKVGRLLGIGQHISENKALFSMPAEVFSSTGEFLNNLKGIQFKNELVLIKGARVFEFEKIVQRLQQKIHGTVLEINLDALINNLNFYKSRLRPDTRIMAMVKAFAYGSGIVEIAHLLQYHRVDYLAVAYADEGVVLRENGITLPIMIMNPATDSFGKIIDYGLEPEIYSIRTLKGLTGFLDLNKKNIRIHIKLDTGMHRLGFEAQDLQELAMILKNYPQISVVSVFSHLSGADECIFDEYTHQQVEKFVEYSEKLNSMAGISPVKHLLNSAGIVRFPEHQFDMVRLGIGLYGVDSSNLEQGHLEPVGRLKTRISQIKILHAEETIGYSRSGKLKQQSKIATIGIGYADGFTRAFGNGKGIVMINGKKAPVIGNVCMDMTMIDVTDIEAEEGDEVLVFGKELSINELANRIGTIPYEILTNISDRVKRVFFTG
jgi:Alr-MurF fusion protein